MNLFWRRESQKLGSGSGRGGRAPRLERFASEQTESGALIQAI
jgi:hypothetical protein